jgi:hypothetical protein
MIALTKEEIQADLKATEKDIERLVAITRNLDAFIRDSLGEDRSAFRTDLVKYQGLLEQAEGLHVRILRAARGVEK